MKKLAKRVLICGLISALIWGGFLLRDRKTLREGLIRFHVVANSNSERDQTVKLQVRDAVLESLQEDLKRMTDMDAAKTYLTEALPKIQRIANETLAALGYDGEAVVSLCREAFDTRIYDTFALPSGIYESLRITIGSGEGKNWWCVAFPTLCLPATIAGFADTAAGAGFSDSLSNTLTGTKGYQIRFFFLDALGTLENMFCQEK